MRQLLAFFLIALSTTAASAVCPTPWTGATYDARSNKVRICSSATDIDLVPLAPTDLTSCTVIANTVAGGSEVIVVTPVVPASSYEVTFSATTRGLGTVSAFCTNSDGLIGDMVGPQSAQFRKARPARPGWLP